VVESINRKPVEILKCQYSYLSFYSDGMLCPNCQFMIARI
jgi:hypothetical protein